MKTIKIIDKIKVLKILLDKKHSQTLYETQK